MFSSLTYSMERDRTQARLKMVTGCAFTVVIIMTIVIAGQIIGEKVNTLSDRCSSCVDQLANGATALESAEILANKQVANITNILEGLGSKGEEIKDLLKEILKWCHPPNDFTTS